MLQIKNIIKKYKTGDLVQLALNDVSLNLRDNEFISILGPSGSGKTTLLNVIGGLDRYDSGDMLIDGISTQKYKDKNWDSYRNHTIGFVFQSYNLIPHQSILANVELALTIGGVNPKERKKRAAEALKEVGLGDHMHKKPNQLSGGQMQRVAIARALVNDPKIVLADEPTGALDTETGIQVMEILKKVAEKRLVVMVTHNPELAEKYSTRIVNLRDGKIIGDSNPFEPEISSDNSEIKYAKSKMSFWTSLGLSFNNLKTKKGRTILTSVAGSIGIIGIALILALSNGVNEYVYQIQRETIENYPITIDSRTYILSDWNYANVEDSENDDKDAEQDDKADFDNKIVPRVDERNNDYFEMPETVSNNLSAFKEFLDNPENNVDKYIGTGSIISVYNTLFQAYTTDSKGKLINTSNSIDTDGSYMGSYSYQADGFTELPQGLDNTISKKTKNNYDLLCGEWPGKTNECVLITDQDGMVSAKTLCQLGFISSDDYTKLVEDPDLVYKKSTGVLDYEDFIGKEFTILPEPFRYQKNKNGLYEQISDTDKNIKKIIRNHGIKISVVGIIMPKASDNNSMSMLGYFIGSEEKTIGYTYKLTNKIIEEIAESDVVKAQLASKDRSVISGLVFDTEDSDKLAASVREYLKNIPDTQKMNYIDYYINTVKESAVVGEDESEEKDPLKEYDKWLDKAKDSQLLEFYNNWLSWDNDLETTLATVGYVTYDKPYQIEIYPDTFEGKQGIIDLMEQYNTSAPEKDQIHYYDYIKELTEQITNIINTVSAILIAFVAVSLIVSCIMIGIITHISVLERTKEIGILRALGASKKNISQVFNAETFIIGLLSGVIGVGAAALLCIPANIIISQMGIIQSGTMNVSVPVLPGLILIFISTFITMLGGIIPAKSASKKDPVVALRTE